MMRVNSREGGLQIASRSKVSFIISAPLVRFASIAAATSLGRKSAIHTTCEPPLGSAIT